MDNRIEETSVCEVIQDYDGQKWLSRLADIRNSQLERFYVADYLPKVFENRNRLYLKDGPTDVGRIGVWNWVAVPRDTDPTKDFINASYVTNMAPIEINELSDISSKEEFIDAIKQGIKVPNSGIETLYCMRVEKRKYAGILCDAQYFRNIDNLWIIREDTTSLPLYEIEFEDTIQIEEHKFLKSLEVPKTKNRLFIKSPIEVIRNIILKRSSWSAMKSAGLTKNEYKHLRDYVIELPNNDLYQEIANQCGGTIHEAESLVRNFIDNLTTYLSIDDIESKVLESIVDSHAEFTDKYLKIVEERWKQSNALKIKEEEEKERSILLEVDKKRAELADVNKTINKQKAQIEELERTIEDKRKLGASVETEVNNKIQNARKDVAEFIAEMTFLQPGCSMNSMDNQITKSGEETLYIKGESIEEGVDEIIKDLKQGAVILSEALEEAGVDEKYTFGFAAYLLSAWETNMSVLLAGPNANDIADAFSVVVSGRTADHLICQGKYRDDVIKNESDSTTIVIVENVFQSNWIDHINSLVNGDHRYYIFTNPFMEDLFIEPHGLYNYMVPIATEMLVKERASRNFSASTLDAGFSVPSIEKSNMDKNKEKVTFLRSIGGSLYFSMRMLELFKRLIAFDYYKSDWDYYYAFLPYATVTGHKEDLIKKLNQDEKISKECKNDIAQFLEAYQ